MRLLFLFSFICSVLAQDPELHVLNIIGTGRQGQIVYGTSINVTFVPVDNKPTSIIIVRGSPDNLTELHTVTDNATQGTYSFVMPSLDTQAATYFLRLSRGSVSVYSTSFRVFDKAGNPFSGPPGRPWPASTSSPVSTSTDTPTPTNAPATIGSPSTSPSSEVENSGGVSTGAKAGIGAGAALGGLALLFGAFYVGRSAQRKRMARKGDEEGEIDPDRKDKFELSGDAALQELKEGDVYPAELPEKDKVDPVELPGHEYTSELPGDHAHNVDTSERPRTNPYEPK